MPNTDDMTVEELEQALKNKRNQVNTGVREGFLKHNLYNYSGNSYEDTITIRCDPAWISKEEVDKIIKEFKYSFEKILSKGTRFVCYLDEGQELWYDDGGGWIEEAPADWAEKHLENVKPL